MNNGKIKLEMLADKYLEEPNKENLEYFKSELDISSNMVKGSVVGYLCNFIDKNKSVKECKELIDLIMPRFNSDVAKDGVYNPMTGKVEYDDQDDKKINM